MTEVRLVVDENGVIKAQLPDGTIKPILVYVHDSAWNGILFIEEAHNGE